MIVLLRRKRSDQRHVSSLSTKLCCTTGRTEFGEELCIGASEVGPLRRDIIFVVDRLNRAYRLTGAAVDTLIGLDLQHPATLIDAIDRAFFDACLVLEVYARLGDDVSHWSSEVKSSARTRERL